MVYQPLIVYNKDNQTGLSKFYSLIIVSSITVAREGSKFLFLAVGVVPGFVAAA